MMRACICRRSHLSDLILRCLKKLEQLVELPSLIDSTRRVASKEKGTHFLEFDLIMRAFEKNFAGEVRSYNLIQWNNFKDDFFSSLFFNDSSKIGMVRAA